MTDGSVRGRFIWHELRTPNPAGARDFYSAVLGWKSEGAEADSPHSTFLASSGPLGGCAGQKPTVPPRWIPFVTVASADVGFRHAVELGAGVVVEPTAVDEGGRYAVLTDPQGATIGLYSADDFGPDRDSGPGEFSWHELATTDTRAALEFYGALFGWNVVSEYDMGPMGLYLIFGRGEKQLGGVFSKASAGMSGEPAWLSYVRVSDLSGTIEKVQVARGSVVTGPMEVPGGDWIAQLLDPHGAAFALHAVAADAKAEAAQAKREEEEAAQAGAAASLPLNAQTAETTISEVSSAPVARSDASETTQTSTKKAPKKKASTAKAKPAKSKAAKKKSAKKKAAKKASKAKKAGGKSKKKKASKKAGGGKSVKKAGAKKQAKKKAKKKAGGKSAAKKAAKKSARKTGSKKKGSKKAAKKASSKKASKKASKKKGSKKKAGKKAGKKTQGR